MSIFLLTPKEQAIVPAPIENNLAEEVPAGTAAPVEPDPNEIPDSSFVAPKQIDAKKIVLDGPLSQVYTEALNQMYAKESYITELVTIDRVQHRKADEEQLNDDYMYVIDGPSLEEGGYVEAFNTLSVATEHWKNVYVCVEHGSAVTDRVAGFMEFAQNLGCKVISTREKALVQMRDHLSGQ